MFFFPNANEINIRGVRYRVVYEEYRCWIPEALFLIPFSGNFLHVPTLSIDLQDLLTKAKKYQIKKIK